MSAVNNIVQVKGLIILLIITFPRYLYDILSNMTKEAAEVDTIVLIYFYLTENNHQIIQSSTILQKPPFLTSDMTMLKCL